MTVKEAILKSLEELEQGGTYKEVFQHIKEKNYCDFSNAQTPEQTVSARLGGFIRHGDNRVKRVKNSDNTYSYYLAQNEKKINTLPILSNNNKTTDKVKHSYKERDLHPLLTTFLKNNNIYGKTIFHEQSNKHDEYQKWVHPDIIGAKFTEFGNKTCQDFFKATNHTNAVEIYSYEVKKELTSDYELKKSFFQAVSNSSWANYGFIAAFEIGSNLLDELERLNHSFGIGVIHIMPNPFESKLLFPAKHRSLDFKTIEKLCIINKEFNKFFEQLEKIITAEPKFARDVKKGMEDLCDNYFKRDEDSKIFSYCKEKNIPISIEEDLL
ncbi:hypothetical protein HMPREF1981_03523 [Bacteroides pyogenes F0041]|uniref:HTH HARE-type domain-containing protein n=1 Tax=Bacteroides pyogenes F0041 TaxID=1321819 RepID=U2DMM3_9BACE|nr:hypothetical protein [Bacteroides pyogenes]ERI80951.1 hypothetical protein HMPREF1981_03523 [Bacteroides pyogenes F0041]MBB3896226.1 hypothetical protein [Bacteroides pyogenes]GAE23326.1 hypothetical protein JCM10003_3065 [Bacteroides pyogenes JCM 10003]SUV30921.1 Uncharacterized protein conserved in bacteria [Bacteroides pyogenes]